MIRDLPVESVCGSVEGSGARIGWRAGKVSLGRQIPQYKWDNDIEASTEEQRRQSMSTCAKAEADKGELRSQSRCQEEEIDLDADKESVLQRSGIIFDLRTYQLNAQSLRLELWKGRCSRRKKYVLGLLCENRKLTMRCVVIIRPIMYFITARTSLTA